MKNKTLNFLGKNKYPLILIALTVSSHWVWYFSYGILTDGDWRFWFEENLREFSSFSFIWTNLLTSTFGQVVAMITIYPVYATYGLLAKIGLGFGLAERFIFLFPASLISALASYFLIRKFLKSEMPAFIGALSYSFNTYFLKIQNSHLTIGVAYALAPFAILAFINLLEKKKKSAAILFSLLFSLVGFYEMRIAYIVFFILFIYFIFYCIFHRIKINELIIHFKLLLFSSAIILLLNLFWVITLFNVSSDIYSSVVRGQLFGNLFLNVSYAITFFYPFWNAGKILPFVNQKIPILAWLLPVFVFLPVMLYKKNKNVLFFCFVSILGILLTKQNSPPFADLYLFLFENFPGFKLFREASKFFILIALGYSVLIAYFVDWLLTNWTNKKWQVYFKYLIISFLIIFPIWNTKTSITGEIERLFTAKKVPGDYAILKNNIINQEYYYRTFWVPTGSRWTFYTNQNPRINSASVIKTSWKDFIDSNQGNETWPVQDRIMDIYKKNYAGRLFDISSIKYVLIPTKDNENNDDFFAPYGGQLNPDIRNWYISELNRISFLKKVDLGTKEIAVYENENFRPHVYTTREKETIYKEVPYQEVNFIQKNPTQYDIILKNIKYTTFVNFSESFHPDWKLRAGDFGWLSAIINKNYFFPDDFHLKNDANLNSFRIDPKFIKENYPGGAYKENPDGSIDVNLTLYFRPQSWFYLGLIISGLTLFFCFAYLGYDLIRRRRNKQLLSSTLSK